ncbi:MAG: SpoVR family protein [Ectothiorhodospiraceae bacterium]|nr:SpoVR family protein [Ectothiorhodospiraceae bacterium]
MSGTHHGHHHHDATCQTPGNPELARYVPRFEQMARDHGLQFYPVDFELVPNTFMMEVAVYGLPVRMPHWSFGVRYIYQYVQHRMGNSRIFEVVFPGDPNRAYLVDANALAENTLVTAHVLGHADFSRNNTLFQRMQQEVGYHIVEQAAARAQRIQAAIQQHGTEQVEAVLDAALALEQHIDTNQPLHRPPYPETLPAEPQRPPRDAFEARFRELPGEHPAPTREARRAPVPPRPEYDLLWFIAKYAPDLDDWERDIFLAVREESYYFYPVFACQIMNEGWASYWHARLLREADFLPGQVYLDAIKTHSDVVRPYAGSQSVALSVNPYHLGFCLWERIIEEQGLDRALEIRTQEDDFSFIRNHLDQDLARELQLFNYLRRPGAGGEERYIVQDRKLDTLREGILQPKFNYGAPRVCASRISSNGHLTLTHDHQTDGRGLDLMRARKVLDYIHRVWRRPVMLETVDHAGERKVVENSRPA